MQLDRGDLDVALVSSFEFLRNPIYRIVDGISISSDGPVYSVVLVHRDEFSRVHEIALDPASKTSAALLQCLLAERRLDARLIARPALVSPEARLLIGDQAIRFLQSNTEFQFLDLGEEWKRMTGLPFVFALWLVRPEVANAESIAARLRQLRDENLRDIEKVIAQEEEFEPDFCRRYYRHNLRFSFGEREREGLRAFASLCTKHGLLPKHHLEFSLI